MTEQLRTTEETKCSSRCVLYDRCGKVNGEIGGLIGYRLAGNTDINVNDVV